MILTDPADPPSALPRGTRLGEYEIRRVLGAGGFGIVYLAFDHALEREVAIKEYLPVSMAGRTAALQVSLLSQSHAESFAVGLRSFVNEARLLARFDHPSLVKVHRYWEDHNTAYMAMPYYAGHNLQSTRRHLVGPPAEAFVRGILEPLLGALERLHHEGVYHRDISPDNIILMPDGRPVLLDFGAARRVLADMSVALTAILKPAYAPIEQYGETGAVKQGAWTDLYALGATLRHLLLGRAPAPATTRTVVDEMPPLAAQALPGCSTAFLQCVDWMLAPRPADRPQSVAALREALDACRAQMPASPLPVVPSPETWQGTQLLDPAAGPAHAATMIDPSLAPQTVRVVPPRHDGPTQVLPRNALTNEPTVLMPDAHETPRQPDRPGPAGRTEPTLDAVAADHTDTPWHADTRAATASASSSARATAFAPARPARGNPTRAAGRRWPWAAGGIGTAALVGLALWSTGSHSPRPADAPLAAAPAATAASASASAPVQAPAPALAQAPAQAPAPVVAQAPAAAVTAAATLPAAAPVLADTRRAAGPAPAASIAIDPAATAPAGVAATNAGGRMAAGPSQARPAPPLMPSRAAGPAGRPAPPPVPATAPAPAAIVAQAEPASPASITPGGRQGLATSITRLPAADAPSAAGPATAGNGATAPTPTAAAGANPAPTATAMAMATNQQTPAGATAAHHSAATRPAAATAAPGPTLGIAGNSTGQAPAAALPNPATPAPPAARATAPARPADRDNEPVLVQARALSPSERCEGRVLVALWACIERQCKADAGLREHADCQKLRREQ